MKGPDPNVESVLSCWQGRGEPPALVAQSSGAGIPGLTTVNWALGREQTGHNSSLVDKSKRKNFSEIWHC